MYSNLHFKKNIKKVFKSTRASLMIFRNIRHQLGTNVAASKLVTRYLCYKLVSYKYSYVKTIIYYL